MNSFANWALSICAWSAFLIASASLFERNLSAAAALGVMCLAAIHLKWDIEDSDE